MGCLQVYLKFRAENHLKNGSGVPNLEAWLHAGLMERYIICVYKDI